MNTQGVLVNPSTAIPLVDIWLVEISFLTIKKKRTGVIPVI